MKTLMLRLAITLEAPLSITMPPAEDAKKARTWDNFPVMPLSFDEDGAPALSGFLPATTLRGSLRRHMVVPDMQSAAKQGRHYKLERVYMELVGQDVGSEKQPDEIDLLAIADARAASPVVDLMGSGLGVKSRLMVSNFTPEHPTLPLAFSAVRKDLSDTEGVIAALSQDDQTAFLRRQEANRKRAQADALMTRLMRDVRKSEKAGSKDVADLKLQLAEAEKLVAKYKTDMGEMQVSTRSLMTHYALPQGLVLKGRMVVRQPSTRDLDLVLTGLDGLSQWPVLGANAARGCGEISGRVDINIDGQLQKIATFGGFEPLNVRNI